MIGNRDRSVRTEFIWSSGGGLCEHDNEPSVSVTCRNILTTLGRIKPLRKDCLPHSYCNLIFCSLINDPRCTRLLQPMIATVKAADTNMIFFSAANWI